MNISIASTQQVDEQAFSRILSQLERKPDADLCLVAGHTSIGVFDCLTKAGSGKKSALPKHSLSSSMSGQV